MKHWAQQADVPLSFFLAYQVPAEAYRERDPLASDTLTFTMDWFKTVLIPKMEYYDIVNKTR